MNDWPESDTTPKDSRVRLTKSEPPTVKDGNYRGYVTAFNKTHQDWFSLTWGEVVFMKELYPMWKLRKHQEE